MQGMDLPFDPAKGDAKLAEVREREEEDVARILSEKYGMTYADLSLKEIDNEALRVIPEEQARLAEAAAFVKTAKALSLAVHNPNNPALAKLEEDLAERGFTLQKFLVSKKSLDKILARYGDLSFAATSKAGILSVSPDILADISRKGSTRGALK